MVNAGHVCGWHEVNEKESPGAKGKHSTLLFALALALSPGPQKLGLCL